MRQSFLASTEMCRCTKQRLVFLPWLAPEFWSKIQGTAVAYEMHRNGGGADTTLAEASLRGAKPNPAEY